MPTSPFLSKNKPTLLAAAALLLGLLGVWAFIAVTKIGVTPDAVYWNEAGVPLLGLQVIAALAASFGLGTVLSLPRVANHPLAKKNIGKIALLDLLLAILVWAAAAGVWLAEPQQQSFNAPRPVPPAYEYYPFSDSTAYDLGGQFALIGQGLNNDLPSDKPLYLFFLAVFHLIGGQSARAAISVQVLVLAVFPVVLYFLGKDIHSRGVGIFVALLAIFKERNAIAAVVDIQVSHAKLMMTEVPTALLVSVAALLLFNWTRDDPSRARALPVWIGGALGAAVLMRTNALLILPLALAIPFLARRQNWRARAVPALLVLLGFALFVSPWFLTNRGADGRVFLQGKFDNVIKRYWRFFPGGSGMESPPHLASLAFVPQPTSRAELSALEIVPSHFFHNQVAAFFILPASWKFRSLEQTIASPLWDKNWDGALTFENAAMTFLNLALLSLGLASAWRRWRGAGLVPAFVEIFYYLANALARTSGSRYLVPVDWVIYFYYALGLFQAADWLAALAARSDRETFTKKSADPAPLPPRRFWLAPVSALLVLGMLLPLPSFVVPPRYPSLKRAEAYAAFKEQVSLEELGFNRREIQSFPRHPDAFVVQGRLLYPRYFFADDGLCKMCNIFDAAFGRRAYPRLAFIVLGPTSAGVIVEMPELPANFRGIDLSNAPDVWAVGCKDHTEYFGVSRGFQSAVRAIVIAVSSPRGPKTYAVPNHPLACQ